MSTASPFLPFPAPLEPASAIRTTLIASSLQSLRTRGLLERYTALLPVAHRDSILHCIAGQWIPLELGRLHYSTCDALGLSESTQRQIGMDVSLRIHETFLGVIVRMAKGVGVTPWAALAKANQTHARVVRGGGIQVTKLGPKDAIIEIAQLPLLEIPYVRVGAQGMYEAAIGMFAQQASVRLLAARSRTPGSLTTLQATWV